MSWKLTPTGGRSGAPVAEPLPDGDVVALRLVAGRLYAVTRSPSGYRVALAAAGDPADLGDRAAWLSQVLGLEPSARDAPTCWLQPSG